MFEERRGIVSERRIQAALRRIHLDMLVNQHDFREWRSAVDWFPHLKHDELFYRFATDLPPEWTEGEICDPQILLQFPHDLDEPAPEITYHVDQEPPWAAGRKYVRIVGIPLTEWTPNNGGLRTFEDNYECLHTLFPGDAIMFSPETMHSGGINRTGEIRYGIYLRWLET